MIGCIIVVVFGVVSLAMTGCRGSGETNGTTEQGGSDTTAIVETGDTTHSADSTSDSTEVERPQPPPPAPAPGTAEIQATVLSVDTTGSTALCTIRIEKVLGYGSSTPPLSTGERTVGLFPGIVQDDLTVIESRTMVLQHSGDQRLQGNRAGEEDRLEWSIQSIRRPE